MKLIVKTALLCGALSCGMITNQPLHAEGTTCSQQLPYWKDIQTVAVNKELPRSSFMSYPDKSTALSFKYEKSPYYQLLNGTWKFYFADSYKDLPDNITDPSVNTSSWHDIKVP